MTCGPGADWSRAEEDCRPVFDAFVEAGGNFIDTANMSTGGASEKLVGRLVAADRERFVISTQYANAATGRSDPHAAGMHRQSLTRAHDPRLPPRGLDYIALYYTHWWHCTTPLAAVPRAL